MTAQQVWEQAEKLRSGGDNHGAVGVYQYLVDHHPTDQTYAPLALYRLCMINYQIGRIEPAREPLRLLMEKYPDSTVSAQGYGLLYLSAIHLVYLNQQQDTEYFALALPAIEKHAPKLNTWEWGAGLARTAAIYLRAGQPEAGLQFLQQHLPHSLRLLVDVDDYWPDVVDLHLACGNQAAALSAARQAYMTCDFTDKSTQQALDLVQKCFAVQEGKLALPLPPPDRYRPAAPPPVSTSGDLFLAAQHDADAPNPLSEVPLPALTAEYKAQLVAGAGGDPALVALAYLYCGDGLAALATLQQALQAPDLGDPAALLKMACRVLRGMDLNLVRANQLAQFAATGEGPCPLEFPPPPLPPGAPAALKPLQVGGTALVDLSKWRALLASGQVTEDNFPQWALQQKVPAEKLIQALNTSRAQHRMDPIYKPLAGALWLAMGQEIDKCLTLPTPVRVKLACYLGLHERPEEAKRLMLALSDRETDAETGSLCWAFADEVEHDGRTGHLLSIWAYKQGALVRSNPDRLWVSSIMCSNFRELGDQELARKELIPWVEEAMALPGAEDRWGDGIYAIVWAYDFVGEPKKGLERASAWLEEGSKRKVPLNVMTWATFTVAGAELKQGMRQVAEARLTALIDALPKGSPERARAEQRMNQLLNPQPAAPRPVGQPGAPPPPPAPGAPVGPPPPAPPPAQ